MERMESIDKRQRKTERFILILYSIYSVNIFIASMWLDWGSGVSAALAVAMTLSWSLYLVSYKSYHFRAMATSILMQISVFLYAIHSEDLPSVLTTLMAFAVFLGLYDIARIGYVTVAFSVLVLLYHVFVKGSVHLASFLESPKVIVQLVNIFLVEYVVSLWVKKRSESDEQMLQVIDVLQEAEQSKNDFLANVSHELRTPINTIYGMSELVLQSDDPQKMKEEVYDIQMAGRNLMSVVSDILDFSELQSGKMEIEEEAYNITSTINDVINMTVANKKDKPIELIVDCDAQIPQVLYGDEKKIRRIVMNMVKNAIKFTNEGCVTITITVRREAYGVNLIVTVRDTGIGMNEESLEKLFTSFNQVDSKRNRQEGGIGLGMAIAKALVQKMGGVITVKSKFGRGTTMKVVIPQRVVDEKPIAEIRDKEKLNVAIYVNIEQFEMATIRDEYTGSIQHMIEKLQVRSHVCRNLAELKRRQEKETFTHVFISKLEYSEDPEYFDRLAQRLCLAVVIDRQEDKLVENQNILRIYKPFYVLPIVNLLNNNFSRHPEKYPVRAERFVAPNVHVLVVDDNIMNIKVIQGLLEKYRIRVTAAESGAEALSKIESMDYDFVFMDVMMPEMDGIETLHNLRKKMGTYYSKVPVIALTANAVAGTREMFLAEGFADFVEKPVEISVLERVLKRNLPADKLIPVSEEDVEWMEPEQTIGDTSGPEAGDALVVGDLNVEKGMIYCGGREQYLEILSLYDQSGGENIEKLEELYSIQDWKNYIITVHAVKSAMLSIGAERLSEMAKSLEMSGKAGKIDYILAHHGKLIEEYKRVLRVLHSFLHPGEHYKVEAPTQELPELSDEKFDELAAGMEEAMYNLNGAGMLEILEQLQGFQYRGAALKPSLAPLKRKIEMSDYMSAVEIVLKLKDRLRSGKGGEAR